MGSTMFDEFTANLGRYVHTNPWLALGAVFVGGLLTASNPCVLTMVPLMMSFVAGRREGRTGVARAFWFSFVFVLGLAMTFTALGMMAALAGKMYGEVRSFWNWIVAAVSVLMGLHLMGLMTIPTPDLGGRIQPRTRGLVGALLLGLLFGLVAAPCAAPMLVVLLTYLAGSGASIVWGGALLLAYALGHSVLIVLAGTSMGAVRVLVEDHRATVALKRLRQVAGGTIVFVGFFFAFKALKP